MSRHHLGSLFGISIALYLPLIACGEDNDILRKDLDNGTQPAQQTNTDPSTTAQPTNTDPPTNQDAQDLSNADQLTSGDTAAACEVSACAAPSAGTVCCTTADDVAAYRAVAAGQCGADMSQFGFPGCTQRDQPGVLDATCPSVTFPPGTPPMAGCCTAAGHCGAMETFMGFGCTTNPDPTTWQDCGH